MNTAPGVVEKDCLASFFADLLHLPRADHMIAHRLDYATSGIVVMARNIDSLKALNEQFRHKHRIYKRYSALVHGVPQALEGEIDLPIGKQKLGGVPLFRICDGESNIGKASTTHWRLLETDSRRSLLQLHPITGRTHQLRLHLTAIGHPIMGDLFYNSKESSECDKAKGVSRLCLHAEELGILHPRSRAPMQFKAKRPFAL
jgi:tRNA pseudouridine32 synthase/23S rRNA pseudouridine746 synthase